MKIKNSKSDELLEIGSAILKFTKKNGQVSDKVRITIRYSKKGDKRKKDLQIPKEINTFDLNWKKYGGGVATYRRIGNSENYDYTSGIISIPTALCHRLEGLVKEVCFLKNKTDISDKTEHIK